MPLVTCQMQHLFHFSRQGLYSKHYQDDVVWSGRKASVPLVAWKIVAFEGLS